MTAGMSVYTDISGLLPDIWDGALIVARDNTLMESLVRGFDDKRGATPRKNSIYGTVTFREVAETDDIVPQTYSRSLKSTLTPAEKAASFFLSDTRIETDDQDVVSDASRELGMGLSQKVEADVLGDFPSLTGGTIGAAGSTLTWGHILAAQSRLRATNAPQPFYCVLHPYQWHQLGKTMTITQGAKQNAPDSLLETVVRNFWQDTVYGINFFTTSNLAIDGNDDVTAAMFSRDALALDSRRAPRLERQRDASRRGWELVMTAMYAHGTWRPEWGIQIISDATAPTS